MALVMTIALWPALARGQAHRIGAASPGLREAGIPDVNIREHEVMGLDSPPTDVHLMPDGRILVVARRQIALGDGVRWETYQRAPDDPGRTGAEAAVDATGNIYVGVPGGFARVDIGDDGRWRAHIVARWTDAGGRVPPLLSSVIVLGAHWFWHGESGPLIAWHPGEEPRTVGRTDTVEQVFARDGQYYASDRTDGRLWRIGAAGLESVAFAPAITSSDTLTCAQPFAPGSVLVGTLARGLQIFDGQTVRPFPTQADLGTGARINDLCQTEGGGYAVAVENLGIVFLDRSGRTIQVIDRRLDHRLADVRRLLCAPGGMVLGLLSDGLLRVGFPARVTQYGPLIGTGVITAHPYRLDGKLWVMADGVIDQGIYDAGGRLVELRPDTPPGNFAFGFSCDLGVPLAGTDHGAYFRGPHGWVDFAPAADNLRILSSKPVEGRWVYGARDEVGWLRFTGKAMEMERIPMPGLDRLYNMETDPAGAIWIEQGNARLARLRMGGPGRAQVEYFGVKDGLPEGWAQVFSIDGIVRFNVGDQILRFDESARRFVLDEDFYRRLPGFKDITGRPGLDAWGRLWITADGAVRVLRDEAGQWREVDEDMPPGFEPYYFTFEDHGVVWMHNSRHLLRYDPGVPAAAPAPLRALITDVHLPGSGRSFFAVGVALPPLRFSDNSLVVHFVAPNAPLGGTVSFEVKLEGADPEWVSTGAVDSAVFNHLKEGHYVFHVRPRVGGRLGTEAILRVVIRPPWYRSVLANLGYLLAAAGIVFLAGRVASLLQRRENLRLERLVAVRTRELNSSNAQLEARIEEIRLLSQAIDQSPVAVFMIRPDGTIAFANTRACEMTGFPLAELIGSPARELRHQTPPAVQAELDAALARGEPWRGQRANRRRDGRIIQVRSIVVPIRHGDGTLRHLLVMEEDITDWLAEQERRSRLEAQLFQAQKLESLGTLAGGIAHDFNNILTAILGNCELAKFSAGDNPDLLEELEGVRKAGLRAKDLVAQILTFSRRGNVKLEPLNLAQPVGEALKLIRASTPATIEVVSQLEDGAVRADATQIQQLVLNLTTNAIQALPNQTGRVEVRLERMHVPSALAGEVPNLKTGPAMRLVVADNGRGMEQATLDQIFDPFFTTKPQGEGTGLGLAIVQGILAAHGGARRVHSVKGGGTTFELFFPLAAAPVAVPDGARPRPRGDQEEILFVDDEAFVAASAGKRLQQVGYKATVFTDPRAALAAVVAAPERFDALVTDLTMPQLTGAELIQKIRVLRPDMPAVIVTGYGHDAVRAQLEALPRCLIVPKPYAGEDLAAALGQVLGNSGGRRLKANGAARPPG